MFTRAIQHLPFIQIIAQQRAEVCRKHSLIASADDDLFGAFDEFTS